MSHIDQFESVFRSAIREPYQYQEISYANLLLVTDLPRADIDKFENKIRLFMQSLYFNDLCKWTVLAKEDFTSTHDLLEITNKINPDFIVTYRNLHSEAWRYPYSLGEHLDVLIQKTDTSVLIVPHPSKTYADDHTLENADKVIALTDRLSSDNSLVNTAVRFTNKNGELTLIHIEDAETFERYIEAISNIQTIDTDEASLRLKQELLKGPKRYIETVISDLTERQKPISIKSIVGFGHHLQEFKKVLSSDEIDLLVINAKDSKQMAMHGLAYPLAVELRQIPILMI